MPEKKSFGKALQKQNVPWIALICIGLLFVALKIPALQSGYFDRDEPLYAWQSLVIYKNPANALLPEVNHPYYALFSALGAPLHALFQPPVPLRIVSLAFALTAILFTYLIGKKLFSAKAGLAAAVLITSSMTFFYFSTRGLRDMPLAALTAILIYLLITLNKRRAVLVGGTLAAMYLIKPASMVVLPAVGIFLMLKYRERLSRGHLALGIAALIALVAANIILSPYNLQTFFLKMLSPGYDTFLSMMMFVFVRNLMGPVISVFALAGVLFLRKNHKPNIALLLLLIVSVCIPFLLKGAPSGRYYLPIVPVLAVIAGQGFAILVEKKKYAILSAALAVSLLMFWANCMPGMHLTCYPDYRHPMQQRWVEMTSWFAQNIGEGDVLIILADDFMMRQARLSAEQGLKNPRKQMLVNPSKGEFETMVGEGGRSHFVAMDSTSPLLSNERLLPEVWIYSQDTNCDIYLAGMGFEKVEGFPGQGDALFMETYSVYKKAE